MVADTKAPMSFAAAANREAKQLDKPLQTVQISGHAVLKIVKHCKEQMPILVTGQLLGLDVGQTLEVTDCFPFPVREGTGSDERDAEEASNYQLDMMRCLREVNVDNNTVGWYQSTIMGSFQSSDLIETFINYQESIKRCVCIIYDPTLSSQNGLAMKAIRLKEVFIQNFSIGSVLSVEKVKAAGIAWRDIFEEIPIQIQNPPLVTALVMQLEPPVPATQLDFDRLNLSLAGPLEKNLEYLNDCLDDLGTEQQALTYYHRNVARQQQQQAQFLQGRRAENARRRAAGEEVLPEDDPSIRPIPEHNHLTSLLITNQIANYTEQVGSITKDGLQKLSLLDALQRVHVA